MNNGWTGGQYSVFRVLFALYLLIHFVALIPYGAEMFSDQGVLPDAALSPLAAAFPNFLLWIDSPPAVQLAIACGALLTIPLALGFHDRWAALLIWYLWACLFGRNPLIANPSIPYVGWMLLAHVFLPAAPYGSWIARGRPDPRGDWFYPRQIFFAAWVALAAGYSYGGYTKLVSPSWIDGTALYRVIANPLARPGLLQESLLSLPPWLFTLPTWIALALELLFLPLALITRARPWLWLALLLMHFGLIVLIDFADLSLGMVLIHLFTFDPAWIKQRLAAQPERLFYDGHCGLCHRTVRFALSEDRSGLALRYAPLDSDAFRAEVPEEQRAGLPDSVIVRRADGSLLIRSRAVLHLGESLGGMWRVFAIGARIVPPSILDRAYDFVASVRHRAFKRPDAACPLVPPELRKRFDF